METESRAGKFTRLAGAIALPIMLGAAAVPAEVAFACEPKLITEPIKPDGTVYRSIDVCTREDALKDVSIHCPDIKKRGDITIEDGPMGGIHNFIFNGGRNLTATYSCKGKR